jgi:hypothetical protein
MLLIPLTIKIAELEQRALQDPGWRMAMIAVLGVVWIIARQRSGSLVNREGRGPQFEDEPDERLLTLEVWDTRLT